MAISHRWLSRFFWASLAYAILLSCVPASRSAWSAEPTATAPASRPAVPTTRPTTVTIIQLHGDAVELGRAQGSELRDGVRLLQGVFLPAFLARIDGLDREKLLTLAAKFDLLILPEHRDEIRALAAATDVDSRDILLGQCFPDLTLATACSTIALPAAASADGIARFGRNLDFRSLGLLDRCSVLLIVHPKDRYAFASVSFPGLVGVLSGMNEHGLALGNMEVPRRRRPPSGMPYMLLYRALLERCKTVDEAVALLRKTPRQSANNLMLMDAAGRRAVVEITPDDVVVRLAPDSAALVSTNHQRGQDLDSPGRCRRYDSLHDAAVAQFGRISESAVEEMLLGAAQGNGTIQSMVFDPANRVIYLALGARAPDHGFKRIDLKPYFRGSRSSSDIGG